MLRKFEKRLKWRKISYVFLSKLRSAKHAEKDTMIVAPCVTWKKWSRSFYQVR